MVNKYGKRLKEALESRKMTQKDLVDLTGLSKSGISQYISGKIVPSYDVQETIAQALDLYTQWFFEDEALPNDCEEKIRNYRVTLAAKVLGQSPQTVRETLEQGRVTWGYATEKSTGKFTFHISFRGLAHYMQLSLEEMREYALS